jgi:putative ABC transport system substrate-binding protein
MGTRAIVVLLVCLAFAPVHLTEAQQTKVPRIGFLSAVSPSNISARMDAFRQGLHELGYVEGKNLVIEYRYAEGKLDRVNELTADLIRLKVDIIVSAGPATTRSAKKATDTIPIVMAADSDPVRDGFVASLAHPGSNITGLATLTPEISGKRLELLKETFPRISRLAVLGTSTEPGNALSLRETELTAGAFGVQIQNRRYEIPRTLALHSKRQARGVLTQSLCCRAPSSTLAEHRLSASRSRASSRRYITRQSGWKTEAL